MQKMQEQESELFGLFCGFTVYMFSKFDYFLFSACFELILLEIFELLELLH